MLDFSQLVIEEKKPVHVSSNFISGRNVYLSKATIISHRGTILGTMEDVNNGIIKEGTRCDCPAGHGKHTDGKGEDYAHIVKLGGGENGISCSGNECNGLLYVMDKPQPFYMHLKNHEIANTKSNSDSSRYMEHFVFGTSWLNTYCEMLFHHVTSGYLQIQIKLLQNVAYLLCYGGLKTPPFYILDLCPSGSGKGENIKLQSKLLLHPVFDIQHEKLEHDILRYNAERSVSKGKDKESIKSPALYKCIHSSDTSKEALFESFETTQAQLVEFGELGLRLKKPDPVIDFICDGYGKETLIAPNYKNQRFSSTIKIDNTSLFFIGDTNLQYLGKDAFYKHLQGGLINRCFIVYDDYIPPYDALPEVYTLDDFTVETYSEKAKSLIAFSHNHRGEKISHTYTKDAALKAYEAELHGHKKRMLDSRNPNGNLYNRSIQNLRAIIEVLHLIKCHEKGLFTPSIEREIIDEGIAFCKRYFMYDGLMNELNGTTDEVVKDDLTEKLKALVHELKLPCSLRNIYKRLHISKSQLLELLGEMGANFSSKEILSLV